MQLDLPELVDVDTSDLTPDTCPVCSRPRFAPPVRGEFPFWGSSH